MVTYSVPVTSKPLYLTSASSIFLDALRLAAALTVMFTHARAIWFREGENDLLPSHLSHGSVVVFFVLSGYVIAYTTSVNKRSAKDYAAARFSRLYSVFMPALIITAIISALLYFFQPALLSEYSRDNTVLRYVISFIFCNEIWFLSAAPLVNGPIWSLGYEFWFYVIFGCFIYRHNRKAGWLAVLLAAAVAGPKILMMMTLWLMGVLAYKTPKPALSDSIRNVLITLCMLFAIALMITLPPMPYKVDTPPLYWAASFISDFIVAIFIGLAFWLLQLGAKPEVTDSKNIKIFRQLADLTFPIYVLHFPLLLCCRWIVNFDNDALSMLSAAALVLLICFITGIYTERFHQYLKRVLKSSF